MIYHVRHTTTYEYAEAVSLCHNIAHLTPRHGPRQLCHRTSLQITPTPAVINEHHDYFGNPVTFFTVQEPHQKLIVHADHTTEVQPYFTPIVQMSPAWEDVRDQVRGDRNPELVEAYQYVFDSTYVRTGPELAEYAAPSFSERRPILEAVADLTQRINRDFRYDQRATTITTTLKELLSVRRGVCQDFAHLEIGCLRSLGLSARYISGYLLTQPLQGQSRLIGADASHAWISVFCPELGWIDFDPTNNTIPSDQHILLAWGRDYDDVSPIKGVILGGGEHTVRVAVDVSCFARSD
jgi:transglutaminase-like putative cysteine protease